MILLVNSYQKANSVLSVKFSIFVQYSIGNITVPQSHDLYCRWNIIFNWTLSRRMASKSLLGRIWVLQYFLIIDSRISSPVCIISSVHSIAINLQNVAEILVYHLKKCNLNCLFSIVPIITFQATSKRFAWSY